MPTEFHYYCGTCGAGINYDSDRFCSKCGKNIDQVSDTKQVRVDTDDDPEVEDHGPNWWSNV